MDFEWNRAKAAANVRKHGVTFEEATTVFSDPLSLTIEDVPHSRGEERFVTLGQSVQGRLLVVVHTDRKLRSRLISARRANRRERSDYENT